MRKSTAIVISVLVVSALQISCGRQVDSTPAPQTASTPKPERATPVAAASTPPGSFCGCLQPPQVQPILPADMALPSQQDANCFAWQEFIALNWPAAPGQCGVPDPNAQPADFGKPNDTSLVVWETYKEASEVFLPNAQPPADWCAPQSLPAGLRTANRGLKATSPFGFKHLSLSSKFAGNAPLHLAEFQEAFTNSWLTAQNGYLTLFEMRMNQDEFNYITTNKLYDATVQQQFVQSPGINLPDGTEPFWTYGKVGAIETKAAWIELDNPKLWPFFKTSQAIVVYPWAPNEPQQVTVGLVGLHIIHKTALGQQFVWATFEHVNNAPSTSDIANKTLKDWYTYYNANCNPDTDPYKCQANYQPQPGTDKYQTPIQVVRLNPINTAPPNNIVGLNQAVWGLIQAANPDSVFLNYQLVNVLWPNNNTPIPAGATTPLTQGDPQPNPAVEKVVNTTLETYFQTTKTCLDCHASAPIASVEPRQSLRIEKRGAPHTSETPTFASDYSFLFSRA